MSNGFYRFKILHLMVLVATLGTAVLILLRLNARYSSYKESVGNEHSCQSNLNNISIALMNYRETFGCFPAPFSADGKGTRVRSWRASILPWFSFDQDLEAKYDFDTPWNSTENKALSKDAPTFYRCPAYRGKNPPQNTSYLMVNDLSGLNPKQMPNNAILVIEAGNFDHDWRSPFDDLDDLQMKSLKSIHPDGFGVVLSDFRRFRLKNSGRIRKQGNFYFYCLRYVLS